MRLPIYQALIVAMAMTCCRPRGEENTMADDSTRRRTGEAVLQRVGGADYNAVLEPLNDIAPDLVRFTIEFAYGDVLSRPGLDLRTRQLCTVAALAGMGTAPAQLKYHISGALNVGSTPGDIIEVILLSTVYAGFPAALNGVFAARDVFKERGLLPIRQHSMTDGEGDRFARGSQAIGQTSGGSGTEVVRSLDSIAPDLGRFIVEFSYGDVIARQTLDGSTRELATVALLTALGTARPQLKVHTIAALNVGASRAQVVEVIEQMAVYAGFPAALNGIGVAKEVFAEQGKQP
jgi:4-carboxymuconolactone decarboxylase